MCLWRGSHQVWQQARDADETYVVGYRAMRCMACQMHGRCVLYMLAFVSRHRAELYTTNMFVLPGFGVSCSLS